MHWHRVCCMHTVQVMSTQAGCNMLDPHFLLYVVSCLKCIKGACYAPVNCYIQTKYVFNRWMVSFINICILPSALPTDGGQSSPSAASPLTVGRRAAGATILPSPVCEWVNDCKYKVLLGFPWGLIEVLHKFRPFAILLSLTYSHKTGLNSHIFYSER